MGGRGTIAVRADANSQIGLGHLRRCLTLLRQLDADGFDGRLVSRRFAPDLAPPATNIPISWIEAAPGDELRDAESTLSIIGRHPVGESWVIVDHYGLSEKWERAIRDAGHKVLAIDDFRDRRHCADILVSDSSAPFDPTLNDGAARELVGEKFALIDPDFTYLEPYPVSGGRKRLLVSYGGSDPTDETTKAMEAVRLLRLDERGRGWLGEVDVVVGPASTKTDQLIRLAEGISDVTVHLAPASLAPLMRKADLFLTAGGNSLVEALAMRKPCLVTVVSDNQALIVAQLVGKQAIVSLGRHAEVKAIDVARAVTSLIPEYELFSTRVRSVQLYDPHGARRISDTIQMMSKGK